MKKILVFIIALMMVIPSFAQKLSKEEKAAQQKALYETMIKSIEDSTWAYVPESYQNDDGVECLLSTNVDFIIFEKGASVVQGAVVCNNSYTNLAEVKSIDYNRDKKGNLKSITMVVMGRHIHGTYKIILPKVNNGNGVNVIYTQSSGPAKRSRGPILPSKAAVVWKQSIPE